MYGHNGVACGRVNGLSDTNGEYFSSKYDAHSHSVRDVEMLRLIGQYLCDKGLNGAYAQLSKESGISLEHIDATELRHATLEGRWNDAEAAVDRLVPLLGDPSNAEEVRFLLLEQRFLEHLEANEVMSAVTLLRNRITPMQRNTERVHTLASCLMCRTDAELRAQAGGWTGKDHGSRLQLIDRIQAFVPAKTMLPPHRLEELIEDSLRAQLTSCIYHNPPLDSAVDLNNISLLQRHSCGMHNFPAFCIQHLHQRDGELWLCQFSPDGLHLAVGGKDANIDVLRVDLLQHSVSRSRVLTTPNYISCLCWSPDSKKLAACCGEEQSCVCVFDLLTGQQLCSQKVNDEDIYSSATFFADSRKLAFGGLKGVFYVMDTEDQGRILTSVEGYRVQSMAAIFSPVSSIISQANVDEPKTTCSGTDLVAPGGPDSALDNREAVPTESDSSHQVPATVPNGGIDHLLVADSLHRIRLFRFGTIGNNGVTPQPPLETRDSSAASVDPTTTTESGFHVPTTNTSVSTTLRTSSISSNPSDLTIYLTSSGAPGSPGATVAFAGGAVPVGGSLGPSNISVEDVDNPSIAAALTVARLSRQQQRLLQSSTISSSGHSLWSQQSYLSSSHGSASTQTSSTSYLPSSTLPPSILFDMPILPVSVTRLGSAQATQTSTHSDPRPALHPHLGVAPYTVVSSSGSNIAGSSGSSLTILFGPPLERSSSVTYSGSPVGTPTTSAEVRALTAAAAALTGSHSRSFAGLVHSLSSMVSTGSSHGDSGVSSGTRAMTTATDTSLGHASSALPLVSSALSSAPNLASGGSSVTATAGFTPPVTSAGVVTGGGNYGLIDHRTLFKETHGVQSITMSRSGRRALITIHKMGLHLWDVECCAIVQRFVGYKQDTFRLTSTFGGAEEQFVASGSENGRIHIWHTNGGNHPIHSALSPSSTNGGQDAVTCVHWNPVLPTMLACVNDAGEIYIWGPQRYAVGVDQLMDDSG